MTATGNNWRTTGAVIVIVVICLAGTDQFLAKVESAEIRNTAQRSYLTGSRLLEGGNAGAATDFLSEAHALERENSDYELQLIAALTATDKTAAAAPLMTDILQREPNDGRANLIAARLMIRTGDTAGAKAYYHRAIYGDWPAGAGAHSVSARMELIELLAARNQKQELLAELISLEAESPASNSIRKRLGDLFLLAGAPARATGVYADLIRKDPNDIAAYEGMGDAALEQSQYHAAREAFLGAFLRAPRNASVRAHLATLNTVTGLDPTLRELTSAEKYRRSIRILEMTRDALDQCLAGSPSAGLVASSGGDSDVNVQLLKTAEGLIAGKAPTHVTNEAAEGVLSLAEKLWHAGSAACRSGTPGDRHPEDRSAGNRVPGDRPADQNALDLIMKRLTS
jgi:tetratricopeptide (TPR) repeat protein